jgi:hypothetical protein
MTWIRKLDFWDSADGTKEAETRRRIEAQERRARQILNDNRRIDQAIEVISRDLQPHAEDPPYAQ